MTHKVKDRKMVLATMQTKPATKLLDKYSSTLGRTQKEDGVNLGYIDALIEEVNHKEVIDATLLKLLPHKFAMIVIVIACKHIGFQSCQRKLGIHELGMVLIHTET